MRTNNTTYDTDSRLQFCLTKVVSNRPLEGMLNQIYSRYVLCFTYKLGQMDAVENYCCIDLRLSCQVMVFMWHRYEIIRRAQ